MTRVLHVPYCYFPDAVGGTEYYVSSLVEHLLAYRVEGAIAAPGDNIDKYSCGAICVYRFGTSKDHGSSEGLPDFSSARAVGYILSSYEPEILHLHARSAAVSELLLEAAKKRNVRTVVTYHTPTLSCVRGTMLLNGASPCDGLLDAQRCTACVLALHGLIKPLPQALSRMPVSLGRRLRQLGLQRGPWLALRMRQIVNDHITRTHNFLSLADRVIAPCQWVVDLLLASGVPAERLRLCRQGLTHPLPAGHPQPPRDPGGPLQLGFFGRLDPTKGIDVLLQALRRIPKAPLELSIYGVSQEGSDGFSQQLRATGQGDQRIRFLPALPANQVLTAMQQLDLVLVPSLWMETGPLVVLEAFAANTPVLGSDRGGIAELVRSGVDGLLLPPGDAEAWANALAQLAANRGPIQRWRQRMEKPRTMADVASEMVDCYDELLYQSK